MARFDDLLLIATCIVALCFLISITTDPTLFSRLWPAGSKKDDSSTNGGSLPKVPGSLLVTDAKRATEALVSAADVEKWRAEHVEALVVFHSQHCSHCHHFEPKALALMKEVQKKDAKIQCGFILTNNNPDAQKLFLEAKLRGTPSLVFLDRHGHLHFIASRSLAEVDQVIEKTRSTTTTTTTIAASTASTPIA